MPKKACCCVPAGSYVAIPCRYYYGRQFIGGRAEWAHYSGSPESGIGGFGGAQGTLLGPFRFVSGTQVFDSTRKIIYMLRGGGGGAGGPQLRRSFPGYEEVSPFVFSKGGHGAYTEYETIANLQHVVRAGKGGTGGKFNFYSGDLVQEKRKGGQGVYTDANGGDAAFIAEGGGWATQHPPLAAAGGGGGGAFFWNDTTSGNPNIDPADTAQIGPRYGGNAGIEIAQNGENGWENVSNQAIGGGGGATNLTPGAAGGPTSPTTGNFYATPGTELGGGRGFRFRLEDEIYGFLGRGGGGGGGLYGGGGGGWNGGGGGGSSTRGNTYSFVSNSNYAANHCNPYMDKSTGIGGKSLPANNSINGGDACVVQYYIYGNCPCDPGKNEIPEPLFICLNQEQYEYIVQELGPQPPDDSPFSGCASYTPLFVFEGEEYILVGQCETACESAYSIQFDAEFQNIRWECAGPAGEANTVRPPCCSEIVCRPVCPIEGANCANCGCADVSDIYVCCNTEGKPDAYTAVYNGWIYNCTKSNSNWIVPGQDAPNITQLCLDPQTQDCSQEEKICSVTINESFDGCLWCGCCDMKLNLIIDIPYSVNCNGECTSFRFTQNKSITVTNCAPYFQFELIGNQCDPFASYILSSGPGAAFSFVPLRQIEEPVLKITFDCIPQGIDATTTDFSGLVEVGSTRVRICDAIVETGGAYLSTVADTLNSLLGGRVSVQDLSGGKYYLGGCDSITALTGDVSTGKLTITVYANHTFLGICGEFSITINVTQCSGNAGLALFTETTEIDSWTLKSLNVVTCPCTDIYDEFGNIVGGSYLCPTPTCNQGNPVETTIPCQSFVVIGG